MAALSPQKPRGDQTGKTASLIGDGAGAYNQVLMARQASLLLHGTDWREGRGSVGEGGGVGAVESAWSESEEGEEEEQTTLRGSRTGKLEMASTSLSARARPSSGIPLLDGVLPLTRSNGEPPTSLSGVSMTPWRLDRFRVAWPGLVASNHEGAASDGTARPTPPNDSFSHIV